MGVRDGPREGCGPGIADTGGIVTSASRTNGAPRTRTLSGLRRHWLLFGAIIASSILTALLAAASPLPLRVLIDNAINGEAIGRDLERALETFGLPTEGRGLALTAAIAFAVLGALLAVAGALTGYLWAVLGNRLVEDVARDMLARTLGASADFHRRLEPAPRSSARKRVPKGSRCRSRVAS